MSTFERVVKILNEMDAGEGIELTPSTTFEELGLDSLSVVEITMSCEDEFGIEIDTDSNPTTLGEFVELIDAKLGE